jgi:NADH-quinone oxidoreductase subunit H
MTASSVDIALFAAKVGLVFFVILTLAAYLVFAERRILAWVQDRKGLNRVGLFGMLQPLADLIKLLTIEDFLPAASNKWLFYLAPAMAAIMIFAVAPFGAPLQIGGHTVPLVMSDLNIGPLFFLAPFHSRLRDGNDAVPGGLARPFAAAGGLVYPEDTGFCLFFIWMRGPCCDCAMTN